MPLSDYDHVNALRNRVLNVIKQKEMEIRELEEFVRALGEAPRLLEVSAIPDLRQESPESGYKQVNRDLTKNMREYLSTVSEGSPIKVAEVVDYLIEKGAQGNRRNLYSAMHVALKKESSVRFEAGRGFTKEPEPQAGTELASTQE